ncbi:hypothetical protein [Pseudactinotalea sp. Z1748]|uniref:hypothetical protein n=1 Tax=Pseudactinotalea sp. Z1748 TaxID=3413027 RepID=UPI003C7B6AB1
MDDLEPSTSLSSASARDDALRRWAYGSLPLMAGVEMLLGSTVKAALWPVLVRDSQHGPWLDTAGGHHTLLESALSGGETRAGLLVLELADVPTGVALGDLLCGIDPRNLAVFQRAVRVIGGGA